MNDEKRDFEDQMLQHSSIDTLYSSVGTKIAYHSSVAKSALEHCTLEDEQTCLYSSILYEHSSVEPNESTLESWLSSTRVSGTLFP